MRPVGPTRHLGLVGVGEEGGDAALVGRVEVLVGEKLQATAKDDAGLARGAGKAGFAHRPGKSGGRGEGKSRGEGWGEPQPTTSAG